MLVLLIFVKLLILVINVLNFSIVPYLPDEDCEVNNVDFVTKVVRALI